MTTQPPKLAPIQTVIATAMTDAGYNELQLANATGIARSTLRRRLRTGDFKMSEISTIAHAMGIASSALLSRSDLP